MFDTCIVTTTKISLETLQELKTKGLPIIFLDNPEAYYDEVGGFHDSATGYNPKGVYCGECTMESCRDCSSRDLEATE
jgi:hypothetical protein